MSEFNIDDLLNKASDNIMEEQTKSVGKVVSAFHLSLLDNGIIEEVALVLTSQFLISIISVNKNGDK